MPESSEPVYDPTQPFLEHIKRAVARTRAVASPYIEYGPDGSYRDTVEEKRDSADGLGSKGSLHWEARTFAAAAQDAFAMVANDLYRERSQPYKLTNTLLVESEDESAINELMSALAELSLAHGVQMGDGETAILNTIQGFELDITMTGAVMDRLPNRYQVGDVLIGLPSNGVHSNGWSEVRRLFPGGVPPEWLTPTRIYSEVLEIATVDAVHGLTHVTGGGLGKLASPGLSFEISQTRLSESAAVFEPIFAQWVRAAGDQAVADRQIHRILNNGVGFILGVEAGHVSEIRRRLPDAQVIGEVAQGDGAVRVQSAYTGQLVEL